MKHTTGTSGSRSGINRHGARCVMAIMVGGFVAMAGCGRNARMADHDVREAAVGPITRYGKTLDQQAEPKDVVYVLLKAVVDDYAAKDDNEAREKAFDVQLATSAPAAIKQLYRRGEVTETERTEYLYRVVRHWAPVLGFYAGDFEAGFETLADRMLVRKDQAKPDRAEVYLNVSHPDPEANPNAGMVAVFRLVKEADYWRIWSVGWDTTARDWHVRFKRSTEPTSAS